MPIQFWDGKVLFVDGKIAMDPKCCCVKQGCYCPSNLADKYRIRFPYQQMYNTPPNSPDYGRTYWDIIVRRPVPARRDYYTYGDGQGSLIYKPPVIGNCLWYGELSADWWGNQINDCGYCFLILDNYQNKCRWYIAGQDWGYGVEYGSRDGTNGKGPKGLYGYLPGDPGYGNRSYGLWLPPGQMPQQTEVLDADPLPSWWPSGL